MNRMVFQASFLGNKYTFNDDYLRRYVGPDGELEHEDLNHRFMGQIIGVKTRIKGEDVWVPYRLDHFGMNSDGKPYWTALKVGSSRRSTLLWTEKIFLWDIPPLGIINFQDTVLHVGMDAAREWRHGLSADQLKTIDPLMIDTRYLRHKGLKVNTAVPRNQIIHPLYKQEYFGFDEVLQKLERGERRAGAFSNKYFLANSILSERPVIGYKVHIVGELQDDNQIHLTPASSHLVEELSDYRPCTIMEA